MTTKSIGTNAIMAAALLAIIVVGSASVDEVVRWNQVATDATVAAKTNPLTESRIFAILHVAIHDAVNAVEPRYEPYQPRTSPAPAGASVEAAMLGPRTLRLSLFFRTRKQSLTRLWRKRFAPSPTIREE